MSDAMSEAREMLNAPEEPIKIYKKKAEHSYYDSKCSYVYILEMYTDETFNLEVEIQAEDVVSTIYRSGLHDLDPEQLDKSYVEARDSVMAHFKDVISHSNENLETKLKSYGFERAENR